MFVEWVIVISNAVLTGTREGWRKKEGREKKEGGRRLCLI